MIVSTIQGISVEISEEVFAVEFELPMEGLTDLSDVPKDLVFDVRSIFSEYKEQVITYCKKKKMKIEFRLLGDILAKTIYVKAGSFDAVTHERFLLMTAITFGMKINWSSLVFDILKAMVTPAVGGSIEEVSILGGTVFEQGPAAESIEERQNEPVVESTAEVLRTTSADDVDFIIQQVVTETAQLETGEGEQVDEPDVSRETVEDQAVGKADEVEHWFDLPYEVLFAGDTEHMVTTASDTDEEMEPVDVGTGVELSADEAMSLEDILMTIPVDCPLTSAGVEITKITLGESISIPGVDEGDWYRPVFPRFLRRIKGRHYLWKGTLLNRLATLKIDESYFDKEALILSWAETDSTRVALNRRTYILTKYRELLIRKFLEARKINFIPGEGSSATDLKVLEMLYDLHMFVVEDLKEQTMAHGLRWEKTCCSKIFEGRPRDRGAIIARTNTNIRSTCWIRTMIRVDGVWVIEPCGDHWVKIPREIVNNEISRQRSYEDTLPPSPVISWRLSQLCSAFVQYSLFAGLSTANISSFVSTIAFERIVFRDVQIAQISISVAPSVQMMIDQSPFSSSTSDDSSMHFDDNDTADTSISLPPAATNVIESLDLEKRISARFDEQDRVNRALRKDTQKNLLSLDLKSTHQKLSAQIAAAAFDTVDVRKEVKEINAKVTYLDGRLLKFEVSNSTFVLKQRKIISIFLPNSVSSLIISEAVMPKRGKVVAAAPNHLLTIKVDPAGEVVAVAIELEVVLGIVVAEVEVRGGDRSGFSKKIPYSSGGGPFRRSFEDWLG
ncbi:hypothetical protein F511_32164 [Dorcoceras hygrometricum]|uniref:Uncharacterized protein n=1 Tax=Dorcoceras hygrometricum TaxID=472368 RepID=A0A2Z7D5F1_9LAMI|nr:hypothetical protein F511_32164 [Dorcoceras hygrometricum]